MIDLAIDPRKAATYRGSSRPGDEGTCTMCGEMCPMKSMKAILG
jgi:phosphomethylpyrimidine synthase